MKPVGFLGAVASIASIALGTPASASIIKVMYQGTVSSGYDYVGTFGTANSDLTGLAFTSNYTFDTALSPWITDNQATYSQVYEYGGSYYGTVSPSLGASLTINGFTFDFAGNVAGDIYAYNDTSGLSQAYHSTYGNNASSYLYNYVYGQVSPSLPLDIDATYSWNPSMGGNAYGQAISSAGRNQFDFVANLNNVSSLDVIGTVPEPGTFALIFGGVGLLGFVARRRKLQAPT